MPFVHICRQETDYISDLPPTTTWQQAAFEMTEEPVQTRILGPGLHDLTPPYWASLGNTGQSSLLVDASGERGSYTSVRSEQHSPQPPEGRDIPGIEPLPNPFDASNLPDTAELPRYPGEVVSVSFIPESQLYMLVGGLLIHATSPARAEVYVRRFSNR